MRKKKRRAARKPTRTEVLERRVSELEKQSKLGGYVKTAITAGAVASAIYARKGVHEILAIVGETLSKP